MGAVCLMNFSHGGNIFEARRKYNRKLIDFSANINPLGLPAAARKIIAKNIDKISYYPDVKLAGLAGKIAGQWGINEENIILGNGSAELIYLVLSAFRPKNSIIVIPSFSEYERAARAQGSKITFLKLDEKFRLDLSLSDANADMVFLCNPNNPTGNIILEDKRAVERWTDSLVVIDEAFMDFVPGQKKYSFVRDAARKENIVVIRSFTKFFALPGIRIGYMSAHKKNIARLKECLPPWNTNCLALAAAAAILEEKKYIEKSYALIEKERKFLFEGLNDIKGLNPYPSSANFILIKIEHDDLTSDVLAEKLIEKGFLVRDCRNFRGLNNKYIRIAVRLRRENEKLISALRAVVYK